jgi:lysophospholipase L1-like esterase
MTPWLMTTLLFLVILLAMVFLIPTWLKRARKQGEDDFLKFLLQNGFHQRVADFQTMNNLVQKGGITFVGDSITQEFPLHEYFPNQLIYNRGIGGDTTVGLRTRLEASIFALNPSMLVLQIGTNDFSVLKLEAEQTISNMTQIINDIRQKLPKLPILLISVYPLHESTLNLGQKPENFRSNARIRKINDGLSSIKGVTYLNIFNLLQDQQGQLNMNFSRDGLHLNAKGYEVVAGAIKTYLNS